MQKLSLPLRKVNIPLGAALYKWRGLSAYQSECCHGAQRGREREGEASTTCCLFYAEWLFLIVVFFFYFPTKKQQGKDWVMLRSGKLAPWEGSKHGKITAGSVVGPSVDSTRVQRVCLVYSHPVTQHLSFKCLILFTHSMICEWNQRRCTESPFTPASLGD